MDWLKTLAQLAPTVASALGGPLAGAAVSAIGSVLGLTDAKPADLAKVFKDGQLTPEQITQIRELELKYQADEKERGFRYAELAVQDRDSARKANVAGGVQMPLFWLSLLLLLVGMGVEGVVLFHGVPPHVDDIITGRILGLMDAVIMLVLSYWYGTTNGSQSKDSLLANK
jgi:hypothetical protein